MLAINFSELDGFLKNQHGIDLSIPGGGGSRKSLLTANLGDIISSVLPYLFVIAGILLLMYLVWGGFQLLTSAGSPEQVKAGQKRITSALVGFLIIFVSYWLVRILEAVFGLKIL